MTVTMQILTRNEKNTGAEKRNNSAFLFYKKRLLINKLALVKFLTKKDPKTLLKK